MAKKKTTTKKKTALPTIKIEADIKLIDLLYKIITAYPAKKLIKLLGVLYMQEGIGYATSLQGLLADKNDVENVEAMYALAFLTNNWDEAVKKGSKIISAAMNKADNERGIK